MRRSTPFLAAMAFVAGPGSIGAFQEKGSIEGRVVNAVSNDPVRRVILTLTKINAKGDPATTQTDGEGHFAFSGLEAGAYRLEGERSGFQRQAYGARLNLTVGTLLSVGAGAALKDVTFKLVPDAVISGQVLDQDGEPMPNLMVSARRRGYAGNRREWVQAGATQTNDRGEYRIAGLRPGRYIVLAMNMNLGIALAGVSREPRSDRPDTTYASTYYGNTLEVSRAAPIEIRMGDDRRGTNIQMIKTTTVRVRGKVVNPPEGSTLMMLLLRRGTGSGQAPGSVAVAQSGDGSFEITGVTPGSYLLTARSATDPLKVAGAMPLEVGDRHVEGLEFRLSPGAEVRGHITILGEKTAGREVRVSLEGVDEMPGDQPSAGGGEDGRFTLKGVYAGKYRVRVNGLPENAYVRSVKLGGQEVDESGVELGSAAELEIALSPGGAQVEGVVSGPDGKPVASATVTFLPDSKRESSYASTRTDQNGTFLEKGLRPGRYKVLAWEDMEAGAFRDPEFVKPFESRATAVALEENGRVKMTLQGIPFEEAAKAGSDR